MADQPDRVIETIYPEGSTGFPSFTIRVECRSHSCEVTAESVVSRTMQGEVSETEPYLRAYMKWDDCCHWWFGDGSEPHEGQGYLHTCTETQALVDLISWIHGKAPEWIEAWNPTT